MKDAILIGPDTVTRAAIAALLELVHGFDPNRVFAFEELALARDALATDDGLVFVLFPDQDHRSPRPVSDDATPRGDRKLIFLVSSLSPQDARDILALKPRGVVFLHESADRLHDVIHTVHNGHRAVSSHFTLSAWTVSESPLTPRETQVLASAAGGSPPKEIATTLGLAAGTVRNHLTAVQTKLRTRSLVDSIRVAREAGWLE
ncbi:LuxR C-terminal-related transcriptional regulator [Amycolatopsis sp., V23-08]|uniref:LuxR C-terminal-related transcriptional regulator n=1 Tax=Amycolatopsis heterodermiae TaxID=3110235 RepID=A0ABU5RB86_9PSEU|nr:LuxR C-terminal-related transcriptional regulator [Amycolatopsis sp., V23-08]MEA5363029.1 LuxR C-terminal-related transcriptional regulator [Amycolatopsis sp., V23-08]